MRIKVAKFTCASQFEEVFHRRSNQEPTSSILQNLENLLLGILKNLQHRIISWLRRSDLVFWHLNFCICSNTSQIYICFNSLKDVRDVRFFFLPSKYLSRQTHSDSDSDSDWVQILRWQCCLYLPELEVLHGIDDNIDGGVDHDEQIADVGQHLQEIGYKSPTWQIRHKHCQMQLST